MTLAMIDRQTLLTVLAEVNNEMKLQHVCSQEKAQLLHEIGSIQGLLGNVAEQKLAWEEALKLDPNNITIKLSVQNLT